jgi:CPA1 family monovalent cation:H+ antiporter
MHIEAQITGLLIIAVLVAVGARRMDVPYTIAMVLTGLGVSFFHRELAIDDISLAPRLILITLLPGLLFEAAYHLDMRKLQRNLRTILLLAVPGILISMFIIGILLNQLLGLPLAEAMLFGIIISATDPIAVVALFKELGVSRRLSIVVEGESLFNDGAAIVFYSILLGVATGDQAFSLTQSIGTFLVTAAGGAALGFIAGQLTAYLMQFTEEHVLNVALTAILAYGTYLFAEEVLHGAVSPVIAVVVAAIIVGNATSQSRSASAIIPIIPFWEFIAFLINSAIFLLIGLTFEPRSLLNYAVPVLVTIVVILFARALVVYPLRWVAHRFIRPMPARWGHILFWGGLRGAVSMALALSLPARLASREMLITMAFGYVLFSLIVQGLTIRPLLTRLGMAHISPRQREYELYRARLGMAHAAIHTIDILHDEHMFAGPIRAQIRDLFRNQIDENWNELEKLLMADPTLAEFDVHYIQHEILGAQKQALRRIVQRGILSGEVEAELRREIDELIDRVDREDWEPNAVLRLGLTVDAHEEDTPD